jgi:hypothetical protein
MKKNHFIISGIILIVVYFSCLPSSNKIIANCNCLDSITVYGNQHLVQSNVLSPELQEQGKKSITKVQKWQYQQISENFVILEGMSIRNNPYTSDEVYVLSGVTTVEQKALVREFVKNYETGIRFILEGKKVVYGGENDSLAMLQTSALMADPQFALSTEFQKLNDARSEQIAKIAELVCVQNQKRVAIIIGCAHLEWFEKRGYNVKYPPTE